MNNEVLSIPEIRQIIKKTDTNPAFKIEFVINDSNGIAMRIESLNTTMPSETKQVSSLNQIGDKLQEYIKDTSIWV
ncbi:MAG: hypothetical protein IJZ79_03510 [Bacilli bacterium]|nr:hypothetical protein [Bacilli bacterium]MBQ8218796.1 hypothetical protein [Bacilli bacterium]